jgi:uncharacterized membrane protein AbrB (regulator of aidB expression)
MSMRNEPLDQFPNGEAHWYGHWAIVYLPLGILLLGVLARLLHFPASHILIATGLLALILRAGVFFFLKKRPLHEWFYFLSRITLTILLGLQFGFGIHWSKTTVLLAVVVFIAAALMKLFWPKNKKEILIEDQEED